MYSEIIKSLTEKQTTLVAVSKTKSIEQITEIYDQGQRIFGENRVQELVEKKEQLPEDIDWHLIGSLQTNKVKNIASFVSLIHSVDSLRLAQKISDEAAKHDRVIDVLLQVKIAAEYAKQGFNKRILYQHLEKNEIQNLKNIRVVGLMGMASFTDNESQVGGEFKNLRKIFNKLKSNHFEEDSFKHLSMGMSGDYELAIENGSNMVRIGSLIFGARD